MVRFETRSRSTVEECDFERHVKVEGMGAHIAALADRHHRTMRPGTPLSCWWEGRVIEGDGSSSVLPSALFTPLSLATGHWQRWFTAGVLHTYIAAQKSMVRSMAMHGRQE